MTTSGGSSEGVRIGVSGHQGLPPAAVPTIVSGLRDAVASLGDHPTGISSLAAGSDQLFADAVLAVGGRLTVVLPCSGYEHTQSESTMATYRRLLMEAGEVEVLPFVEPSEEAFYAAGRRVVDLCQVLVAVWDGQPARGLGGTADVVAYARQRDREVRVIWPVGVSR